MGQLSSQSRQGSKQEYLQNFTNFSAKGDYKSKVIQAHEIHIA